MNPGKMFFFLALLVSALYNHENENDVHGIGQMMEEEEEWVMTGG